MAIAPGNEEGWTFPEVTTPIEGYYRCGDSTTSGIGVPAVASSGALCANSIMSVWEQLELNSKIKMPIQYGRGPVTMTSPQPEKAEESSMFAPLTSLLEKMNN